MNFPQFSAEASLGLAIGTYQGNAVGGRSSGPEVQPMLASCSNCELVGGWGRIRGVGMRSCCRSTWDPIEKRVVTTCWFESCTPVVEANPWFAM
jgi:hypothetical protein